jgi:hypothetical protein
MPSQEGNSYPPASIVLPLQQSTLGKLRNWETGTGGSFGSEVGSGVSVGAGGVGMVVGTLVGVTGEALLQAARISMSIRSSAMILFIINFHFQ